MFWLWRAALAIVVFLGSAYAGYMVLRSDLESRSLMVANGIWRTNPLIGSAAADPYTRAGIALTGLLALPRREAIYYNADTDEQGRPLRAGAVYEIRGGDLPGRWWSLTAYGDDDYLIPNEAGAYSIKSTRIRRGEDGGFVAYLSPERRGENWIGSGDEAQTMSLTLRLYVPPDDLDKRLARVSLPRVRRIEQASR